MVAKAIQACPRVKITALVSGTPAKLASWGEKYQVPESSRYNYSTVDQIKDNKEVDKKIARLQRKRELEAMNASRSQSRDANTSLGMSVIQEDANEYR